MTKEDCNKCPSAKSLEKLQELERIFGTLHSYSESKGRKNEL